MSPLECPVFTVSNLGTHLAVPISPDATARDFKRVFERAHLHCFPEHGEIVASSVMVQRKAKLYHLSDTLPIKHVFQYLKGNWFLHVRVYHSSIADPIGLPEGIKDRSNDGEPENFHTSTTSKIRSSCRKSRGIGMKRFTSIRWPPLGIRRRHFFLRRLNSKRKRVGNNCGDRFGIGVSSEAKDRPSKVRNSFTALESHYEALSSETMSVSGIMKKYLSYNDYLSSYHGEVNSSSALSYSPPEMLDLPLTNESVPVVSSSKVKSAEVGKRLLTAGKNLGFNASSPSIGLRFITNLSVYDIPAEDG
ncbi:unnamed protein product [Cuscuta epithymum]|uniref:Uncharacterized protein n=2 Tax=Cuscuta epithymum TaxID=186058 RepID=A0AAV0CRJ5_9ASTE|nr:unnamed protein product [Cuscuta epithymum]CAH9136167.1 unnamed protein product [Cuscuta epithymum]CAH9148677.1 unnamed protein product [Cuscuta epithymum]